MRKYTLFTTHNILWGALAATSSLILIASQIDPINIALTSVSNDNGDEYRMAKIKDFKIENVRRYPSSKNEDLKTAEVIVMGDSFSHVSLGYSNLATQLRKRTTLKVHTYNIRGTGERWRVTNPLTYLSINGDMRQVKRRILILESVDRNLLERYDTIDKAHESTKPSNSRFSLKHFYEVAADFEFKILGRISSTEYFLTENILITRISEVINTHRYRLYHDLPSLAPYDSENPKVLFSASEKSFSDIHWTGQKIEHLANNIATISKILDTKYNISFIFIPMPSKYTCFQAYTMKPAQDDQFFDIFLKKLTAKGVKTIDLYHPFQKSPVFPYWAGDTHLNTQGDAIFVDNTVSELQLNTSL